MWDWSSRVVILPYIKKSAPNQHSYVKTQDRAQIFNFTRYLNFYVNDGTKSIS